MTGQPVKHILVVSGAYAPDRTGIAPLETELCEYLAGCGHRVSVVTGLPHYPEWRVPPEYRGKWWMEETRAGIQVYRGAIYVPPRRTTLRRILFDTSIGVATALRGLPIGNVDVVLAVSPPLQAAMAGWMLSLKNRVPLVLHLQDLIPDLPVALGMLRNPMAIAMARKMERFLYRRASAIFVISEGFRENLLSKRVPESKLVVVPNWTDTRVIGAGSGAGDFRKRHQIRENDFLVLHTGNMGAKQKLENVMETAAVLRSDPAIVFCLVGGGTEKNRLEELAVSRGLKNVRFLPLEPRELLPNMLAAADVLLVNQSAQVIDMVIPSKLVTYMAAGRAVVAAVAHDSEAARAVDRADCGLVVPPENPAALASAVLQLKSNREQAEKFGRDGRRYAECNFDREPLLARFERALNAVGGNRIGTKSQIPDPAGMTAVPRQNRK
ncbi:MAG: WcaI family glycosyltransferase [Acidipila sp.]|nr:WcaI family glycosyltransferase [Acidipila sp.]